ncbi:hypothetical protein GCM10007874_30900 [Labrys miyagiensis]|uniref:Histidine phosphatase family protein n=1 Tax=Labrys miyagiensis TaxID=346912 RepID=A0ABQ6CIA2_9HYPH|nr:hypothetical protein [Labrys miyagiensis]GLS20073.1 hypothetical protein GCM10007874_30900 [Labrys miyagiensis]
MAPQRIVILRHAEKPADANDPNLSPAGQARAQMLATLIPQLFPNPNFLFAAAPSTESNRPVETLQPTATALNMTLNASYADGDYARLAGDLLSQPAYDGTLIIICWHHGHIPKLAKALGVASSVVDSTPPVVNKKWDSTVFDRFWILDFSQAGVSLTSILQEPPQ